ncbi:MAG: hypothetical protein VZS44_11605 [Bacilli bacterium]|nr:hypothetical protein [Bacilli bacterium]
MFVNIEKVKKQLTMPSYIFDDPEVSIGAKGLYAQLLYSNSTISSLSELTILVNSPIEELTKYFEELTECGYLVSDKNGKFKLLQQRVAEKKRTKVEEATNYAETTQEKPKNAYDIMVDIVNEKNYDIPTNVRSLLITYFDNWFRKVGRFADADKLNRNKVRTIISHLIAFHLPEEEQLACVQQSIDKQYYDLYEPRKNSSPSSNTTSKNNFTMEGVESNTYTKEDIEKLKERMEQRKKDKGAN